MVDRRAQGNEGVHFVVVSALKNAYPYVSPSEFVELIKMYGDMKSGITGMLGKYPFS